VGLDRQAANWGPTAGWAEDGAAADRQHAAGTAASPAIKPAVASDNSGTTLIAYKRHPDSAETPISIGLRMLVPQQFRGRKLRGHGAAGS